MSKSLTIAVPKRLCFSPPPFLDGPLPSVMQEVDLPVINNTECELMYKDAGYVEHIPNIFICAGYAAGGKDSCEVRTTTLSTL